MNHVVFKAEGRPLGDDKGRIVRLEKFGLEGKLAVVAGRDRFGFVF